MSKIKLVPCSNITKRELMKALMDGRRFAMDQSIIDKRPVVNEIHWDSNFGNNPVRIGESRWNWRGFKYLHEIVEQQWYEDPDMMGKPCYFWDEGEENHKTIGIFSRKSNVQDHRFVTNDGDDYYYAEPLTTADLYQGEV